MITLLDIIKEAEEKAKQCVQPEEVAEALREALHSLSTADFQPIEQQIKIEYVDFKKLREIKHVCTKYCRCKLTNHCSKCGIPYINMMKICRCEIEN